MKTAKYTPGPITVKAFKVMLKKLKVPDSAIIKFPNRLIGHWEQVEQLSFCRPENEVSIW